MKILSKCFISTFCFLSLMTLVSACNTASNTGSSSTKTKNSVEDPTEENNESDDNNTSVKTKYSDIVLEKDPATNKVYDFDGLSVVIYDWYTESDSNSETDFQKEQKEYREFLEKAYNFKCIQKKLSDDWDDYSTEVFNYCKTNNEDSRIFVIDSRIALSGHNHGLWADVSKVPDIDWTKEKWNKAVCNDIPDYTFAVGIPEPQHCIFFNKQNIRDIGINPDSIYDDQKQGKWTWSAFEHLCCELTRDTDNDGIIDVYALSSNVQEFVPAIICSNNGQIICKDSEEKFKYNTDDNTMDAWDYLWRNVRNHNKPRGEGAPVDYYKRDFLNKETSFYTGRVSDILKNGFLSGIKDELGMVCIPVPDDTNEKYFSLNNDNMLVIPACYSKEKINKIMKIYDIWSNSVPGYEKADLWKENYYDYFSDTRAVDETLQYMINNSIVWKDELYNYDLKWNTLVSKIFRIEDNDCMDPYEVIDTLNNAL